MCLRSLNAPWPPHTPVSPLPHPLTPRSLTHVVSVRGLAGSVLQTRQDLALPDVAVAHQQELEQKVVRPGRARSVAHPRAWWQLPCPIMRRDPAAESLTYLLRPGPKREDRRRVKSEEINPRWLQKSTIRTLRVLTCSRLVSGFRSSPGDLQVSSVNQRHRQLSEDRVPPNHARSVPSARTGRAALLRTKVKKSSADGPSSAPGLQDWRRRAHGSSLRLPAPAEAVSRVGMEGVVRWGGGGIRVIGPSAELLGQPQAGIWRGRRPSARGRRQRMRWTRCILSDPTK